MLGFIPLVSAFFFRSSAHLFTKSMFETTHRSGTKETFSPKVNVVLNFGRLVPKKI